jgi:hypothetical protein
MKVQISQNPDVLGEIQSQNRNQQLNIYQKKLSLARGKKLCPFVAGLCYLIVGFEDLKNHFRAKTHFLHLCWLNICEKLKTLLLGVRIIEKA